MLDYDDNCFLLKTKCNVLNNIYVKVGERRGTPEEKFIHKIHSRYISLSLTTVVSRLKTNEVPTIKTTTEEYEKRLTCTTEAGFVSSLDRRRVMAL